MHTKNVIGAALVLAAVLAAGGCTRLTGGGAPPLDLGSGADARPDTSGSDLPPTDDGPRPDAPGKTDGPRPDTRSEEGGPKSDAVFDASSPDLRVDVPTTEMGVCGDCPLGCATAATRCKVLVPATLSLVQTLAIDAGATADCDLSPMVDQTYLVNTSTGTFSGCLAKATFIAQANGPAIAVFAVNTLRIGQKASLLVTGSRAVLFYARRTIVVEGAIRARAVLHTPGPGGKPGDLDNDGSCWFPGGAGRKGSGLGNDDSGGGGGAWSTAGADGGDAASQIGGMGGAAKGLMVSVFPLIGGCSGGSASGLDGGRGGAGGGAVHLAAGQSVTITGVVNAGGGGGGGGTSAKAGGGGGSGGTIVIESQAVASSGTVAANGGGGGSGAGNTIPGTSGTPGENGLPSVTAASGGASVATVSGTGGKGSASGANATRGANGENAGGGGGGLGRIHLRALVINVLGATSPPATSDSGVKIQ